MKEKKPKMISNEEWERFQALQTRLRDRLAYHEAKARQEREARERESRSG